MKNVQLILGAISLAREGLAQLDMSKLDTLPPELKAKLLAERDALLDEWRRLAPS